MFDDVIMQETWVLPKCYQVTFLPIYSETIYIVDPDNKMLIASHKFFSTKEKYIIVCRKLLHEFWLIFRLISEFKKKSFLIDMSRCYVYRLLTPAKYKTKKVILRLRQNCTWEWCNLLCLTLLPHQHWGNPS